MTLQDLIDRLEDLSYARKWQVRLRPLGSNPSAERTPTGFASWRGHYRDLTIDSMPPERSVCTVEQLLEDARDAVDSVFEGYKGGDYRMEGDTAVWADPYGQCGYDIPVRLRSAAPIVGDKYIVIETLNIGEYR